MSKPSVVIYGPPGCGKTRNAQALAKHFGLRIILDEWNIRKPGIPPADTLVLTECVPYKVPGGVSVYPLAHAMAMLQRGN